jgi:fructan beta-fructosidase
MINVIKAVAVSRSYNRTNLLAMRNTAILFFVLLTALPSLAQQKLYNEKYRPSFHYTTAKNWINDPNGLVYLDGEYHYSTSITPSEKTGGI